MKNLQITRIWRRPFVYLRQLALLVVRESHLLTWQPLRPSLFWPFANLQQWESLSNDLHICATLEGRLMQFRAYRAGLRNGAVPKHTSAGEAVCLSVLSTVYTHVAGLWTHWWHKATGIGWNCNYEHGNFLKRTLCRYQIELTSTKANHWPQGAPLPCNFKTMGCLAKKLFSSLL